jgi:hypothetical protein
MEALSILALTLYPMKIFQTTAKLLGFLASVVLGQHALTQEFPWIADDKIARIDAKWTEEKIQIDGILDEKAWLECAPSRKFVDLISGEETAYSTTVKLLWDNENLYVAYDIEEPNVQGKFTERDSPIYQDNDVEIFIAGENAYYEFEINSLGTIYEGLFVWQSDFEKSGLAQLKELDRNNPALRFQEFNGVGFTKHPRGKRWAFLGWDYAGARSAVAVQGTLNDDRDRDRGWTVELAFPWRGMKLLNYGKPRALPPNPNDQWRIDFSRFNQYKVRPPQADSGGWALSRHGIWDSHIPEYFPYVKFCKP